MNLIRTRSFDYAWRIAIIAGGVVYVLMIIAGGFYFRLDIDVVTLIIYTVISVVIGLLLEFFVFGGDYTRTERLEYEDDEYYYYVKAVPKACVTTSERSIKKINGSSAKDERPAEDPEDLLKELDTSIKKLEDVIKLINKTNGNTYIKNKSISDMIVERDMLKLKMSAINELVNSASNKVDRYSNKEIKIFSTINVKEKQKELDENCYCYRLLHLKASFKRLLNVYDKVNYKEVHQSERLK